MQALSEHSRGLLLEVKDRLCGLVEVDGSSNDKRESPNVTRIHPDSVLGCRSLLLHLQVMEIVSHATKLDIRRGLTKIPKSLDEENLDEAYEATICRMRRLPAPR